MESFPSFAESLKSIFREWNEADHPRAPSGTEEGGQFVSSGGMTSSSGLSDEQKDRLKTLKLPPAWTDVKVSVDPNAALQATGVDSKGRTQYRYSAAHSEAQAAEKFERLKEFSAAVPTIEASALRDMRAGSHAAAATYLIAQTGFRVGSDEETGAAVKAYGATTLLGRHVSVKGDTISFNYTGKKGVTISKTITDRPLATFISNRKLGAEDRVFDTNRDGVAKYMKGVSHDGFKVKDFRTYHGTARAMQAIKEELRSPPTNTKQRIAAERRVAKAVAEHLGNTPTVARAAYIDPSVWERLKNG